MIRELKNLKKHNDKKIQERKDTRLNGFACPVCGEELRDSAHNIMLLVHPPMQAVLCNKCGYNGSRVI